MNQFAISEVDQFEIAAFEFFGHFLSYASKSLHTKLNKAMRKVENLTQQQNEGLDYLYKILGVYILELSRSWSFEIRFIYT